MAYDYICKRATYSLPEYLIDALKAEAAKTGQKQSKLLVDALENWLKVDRTERPRGKSNLATNGRPMDDDVFGSLTALAKGEAPAAERETTLITNETKKDESSRG